MIMDHIRDRWRRGGARAFLDDTRGAITIEFVIWVPILALWFAGSVAFFDAYKERSEAAKAAFTLSDIMSRQLVVSDAFIEDLYQLQEKLLPRTPAGKQLRVSSIEFRNDAYQVLWSTAKGGGQPLANADVPAANMPVMAEFDTVIVTETTVPFEPLGDWMGIGNQTWKSYVVIRPRFIASIANTQ